MNDNVYLVFADNNPGIQQVFHGANGQADATAWITANAFPGAVYTVIEIAGTSVFTGPG